ncbi:MAG: tyrosine-type recombinase/integrase [Peptostreptococcaceae bacterium]
MRVEPIRSKKELERVKRYLKSHKDKRLYPMFMIGVNTGLRISDILPLKVNKVEGLYIHIKEKKTGKYNKVVINQSLRVCLDEYIEDKNGNEYLFPSQKGFYIKTTQAYRLLKVAFKKCRIKGNAGTHTLRKTHGFMLAKTNSIDIVQRALNHDTQRETLKYIGLEQEQMDKVIRDLNL